MPQYSDVSTDLSIVYYNNCFVYLASRALKKLSLKKAE